MTPTISVGRHESFVLELSRLRGGLDSWRSSQYGEALPSLPPILVRNKNERF